jgi:D,D-heptose 1,7-bisphosphate phosphatase
MKRIDAVILAGGYGTRIKKFTKNKIPKPLLKINKKPFLDYLIQNISKYPINKIYIISGHRGSLINKKYHNKTINLIKIHCIKEKISKGTGHALLSIKNRIKNDFILINGDTLINFNLNFFFKKDINKKFFGYMVLSKNYSNSLSKKLNNIDIKKNNTLKFTNKIKYINSGTIFLKKKILKLINKKTISFENDILHKIITKQKMKGIIYRDFLIDIGTPKNYIKSQKLIPKIFYKPAIFLDRDGVINYDRDGYTYKFENFKFKPNILRTLKYLSFKKNYIFIVTNQAGIAKGHFSEKQFLTLHKKIKIYLVNKNIFINEVKYCPFHKNAKIIKYKKNSLLRKPGNLMIKQLLKNWPINKKYSFMIGDQKSDKLAAKKSNLHFEYPRKDFFNQILKIKKKLTH